MSEVDPLMMDWEVECIMSKGSRSILSEWILIGDLRKANLLLYPHYHTNDVDDTTFKMNGNKRLFQPLLRGSFQYMHIVQRAKSLTHGFKKQSFQLENAISL